MNPVYFTLWYFFMIAVVLFLVWHNTKQAAKQEIRRHNKLYKTLY